MNVRWTVALAACALVLLCGALLATAAEPNIGHNRSAMQGSAGIIRTSTPMGTTVPNPQGQVRTVSAASATDNPSVPCPCALPQPAAVVPCAVSQSCPPVPCVVPRPCACYVDPCAVWPENLIEFSEE